MKTRTENKTPKDCGRKEDLIAYLYEEDAAAERAKIRTETAAEASATPRAQAGNHPISSPQISSLRFERESSVRGTSPTCQVLRSSRKRPKTPISLRQDSHS